jgi:EF hand
MEHAQSGPFGSQAALLAKHITHIPELIPMKQTLILLGALALASSAFTLVGQDSDGHRPPPGGPGGPGAQGGRGMMMLPIIQVLDANGDGVIDEKEIANAPAALKKLDKNGDGKLTMDELRPQRPPPGTARPGGPGAPGAPGAPAAPTAPPPSSK